MARGISSKTKKLAVCSILSALGVVILLIGALLQVFDISAAIGASLIIVPVILEYGGMYPFLVFAVTGILSLILMPTNFGGWIYFGLLGYYPMLKLKYEKLKRPIAILLKLLTINVAIALYLLVLYFIILGGSGTLTQLFTAGFGESGETVSLAMGWIMLALMELICIAYDLLLTRVIIIYNYKWRQTFKKFFR